MTRKEEIEQAAHNYALYFPKDYVKENDYIAGAECADKTMLDKVCKYLYRKLENGKVLSSQLIDDLRQAMEG